MSTVALYVKDMEGQSSSETDLSFLLSETGLEETLPSTEFVPECIRGIEATLTVLNSWAYESQIESKFKRLVSQWLEETKFSSSINDIISHPAHMRIIGMGSKVIPWILRRLSQRTELWFWALSSIADEDPVTDDIRGNVQEMRRVWLEWGQKNGSLSL